MGSRAGAGSYSTHGSRAGAGSCSTHGSRVGQVVQHAKRSGWLAQKTTGWRKEVGRLQVHAWKSLGASEVAMSVWARGFLDLDWILGLARQATIGLEVLRGHVAPDF